MRPFDGVVTASRLACVDDFGISEEIESVVAGHLTDHLESR